MIEQSVGDVMTQSVRTVTEGTTACAVARLFAANGIGSAVVVDPETDTILGIVTESDILQQVADEADVTAVTVGSFMSSPVVTVSSVESIDVAAELMMERSIRRLPVVDDGDLVGILTTTNLAYYLPRLRTAVRRARLDRAQQERKRPSR